jgi:hypothetical protein
MDENSKDEVSGWTGPGPDEWSKRLDDSPSGREKRRRMQLCRATYSGRRRLIDAWPGWPALYEATGDRDPLTWPWEHLTIVESLMMLGLDVTVGTTPLHPTIQRHYDRYLANRDPSEGSVSG